MQNDVNDGQLRRSHRRTGVVSSRGGRQIAATPECALDVQSGMVERAVEVVEEVALVGESVERADGAERAQVFRPGSFEEHGDVACFEFGDNLAERVGAGGIVHLEFGKAQDHDLDVGDRGEIGEEALRGTEDECAVEAMDRAWRTYNKASS